MQKRGGLFMEKDLWTESRLLSLPAKEQDYFERKSGAILQDSAWRETLAKAVSAFANSGGGHLIIGVQDDGTIDGVAEFHKGRTSTRDWLEQMVPNLVVYPLQDFSVHEVIPDKPSLIPKDKVVIVIDIGDSIAAPHQCASGLYFCRLGGRSEPAPHHYLEMLRGRERYPSQKIAHAWLNFVITPLLRQLRNEQQTLENPPQPWDGHHGSYGDTRYFKSFGVNLSANEKQFLKHYPNISQHIDDHDNAVTRMWEEGERLVSTISSSTFMTDALLRFQTSKYLQIIRENYRGRLAEDDKKLLDNLFGDRPEDQVRKSIATFITYDYPPQDEPHGLWPIWRTYKADFLEFLRYSPIKEQNERLTSARETLAENVKSLIAVLEVVQEELAFQHGEPYEDATLHRYAPVPFDLT